MTNTQQAGHPPLPHRHPTGSARQPHRTVGQQRNLHKLSFAIAKYLDLYLVLDNDATHKTPAIKQWLLRQPRFHLHFTPTSSAWLNVVERWFAELNNRKLRRCTRRSITELEANVRRWTNEWNTNPPSRSYGPRLPTGSSKP